MTLAIDLSYLRKYPEFAKESIEDSIDAATSYTSFALAGKKLIKLIHSIPNLYESVQRDEIEIYVGRAGKTYTNIKSRWNRHFKTKKHEGAVIAFACPTDKVVGWEGACNKIVSKLKERKKLCIANILQSGGGAIPRSKHSVIYITWRLIRRRAIKPPTRSDITYLLNQDSIIEYALDYSITRKSLKAALDPLSRPSSETTRIRWHDLHED